MSQEMHMDPEISVINGTGLISFFGSMDVEMAPGIVAFIDAQVEAGIHNLVVDLSGVVYASSAGLRALLGAVKKARSGGGDLRLCAAQETVKKVLDLSGFTSIVKYFLTPREAVGSFQEH